MSIRAYSAGINARNIKLEKAPPCNKMNAKSMVYYLCFWLKKLLFRIAVAVAVTITITITVTTTAAEEALVGNTFADIKHKVVYVGKCNEKILCIDKDSLVLELLNGLCQDWRLRNLSNVLVRFGHIWLSLHF